MDIGLVICTEPHIEHESRLFVRSLRRFGGRLADVAVYSYSPRPDYLPSDACLAEFRTLGVKVERQSLNIHWAAHGFANKPAAMAHAEAELAHEVLIFADSDMLVLRALDFDKMIEAADVLLRPVGFRGLGVADRSDPDWDYWNFLYQLAGRQPTRRVETEFDRMSVFEYYNSGLIVARRRFGLFAHWLRIFASVMDAGRVPSVPQHIEQSCFSAAVTGTIERVGLLPGGYNAFAVAPYAVDRKLAAQAPVLVHYFDAFQTAPWRSVLEAGWFPEPAGAEGWLAANLDELGF